MAGQAFFLGQQANIIGDRAPGPLRYNAITLLPRTKSCAERPLANRAVPPVGSTCDGPAA